MPNPNFVDVTNPAFEAQEPTAHNRPRLLRMLGGNALKGGEGSVTDLDMNVAETYGIQWDAEKCGRDALQNFFDSNNGTLDGVQINLSTEQANTGHGRPLHTVSISGKSSYDFRELTVIGATTKRTGEYTAGGFGEGAKFLALSLLRDHGAERVVYRSRDWQLEFFIGDLPASKVARPTRGLFARVATGLRPIHGSAMMVTTRNEATAQSVYGARELFRSSENPDFHQNTLVKNLPDGSRVGVKFLGVEDPSSHWLRLNKGHLYIAGQRRHYAPYGDRAKSWETVDGLSIWTTRDVASGDRDRGQVSLDTLKKEVLSPLASTLTRRDVESYLQATETAYSERLSGGFSELATFSEMVASRGQDLGVKLEFDAKYVAVSPYQTPDLRRAMESAGYVLCPHYYSKVGMKTDKVVLAALHEHQRLEPSPEQQARIDILQEGLTALTRAGALNKDIPPKTIWLYSKALERNPFEGSYDEEFVWLSEEHLEGELATVLATYLHELDHRYGTDQSAEFSYALTNTLAEVLHAVIQNPRLAAEFQTLSRRWQEAARHSEQPK